MGVDLTIIILGLASAGAAQALASRPFIIGSPVIGV
jgi:hypothetical protein